MASRHTARVSHPSATKAGTGAATGPATKASRFRRLLTSPELAFICEAHNGLSARIVEEAGFEGIWASGLSVSAALGVRDNNEASWTQVLEVVEFMADATAIPIMLDGDTGYGNFNNMRRLVTKLESRGVAAVCIEDKLFPKTNSFIRGTAQPLADIDEFCGKIKAGKEAQSDPDFCVVARIEAFIAGWGLDEALRRAEAYRDAGADAVLIHSGKSTPDEILSFLREWDNRCPVVLVPTKYYTTPTHVFRDHGVSLVIWANHVVRAAVTAMQRAAAAIQADENLLGVEDTIAPVAELFRLQGADELERAEKIYLPKRRSARAIVLAASRGRNFGALTADRPKAMLDIAGKPLLGHIAETYRRVGVKDITVVRGFAKDKVNLPGLDYVDNDAYATTSELASLDVALRDTGRGTFISYGDVLFRRYVLEMLSGAAGDVVIAVDINWRESRNRGADRRADFAACSQPNSREAYYSEVWLTQMEHDIDGEVHGEWIGVARFSAAGARAARGAMDDWREADRAGFDAARMNDLFNRLIAAGQRIRVIYTTGNWLDIDDVDDLVLAGSFV